ncbi:BZ3500_MvSof-1268-A1-R1_Chr9g10728 [Microbotryum saponariae]|uniref:BQ5605_C034g11300 protein n=2 Tax=Microbotryum TaxID=34416 RepID=A0A2X0MJB4_9BASI|nr:BZ3501_MvSof-1269-A2-R1_Chr9g10476 [Microbotryum saponariae]SDA00595.1 BZ3500_MvSof-1268-A1-R1_Chr9g10728 [Microbotryum saponariae]SGY99731.1 BQ5605_C034g11300 [Microbotryum silenes-dioicae]
MPAARPGAPRPPPITRAKATTSSLTWPLSFVAIVGVSILAYRQVLHRRHTDNRSSKREFPNPL